MPKPEVRETIVIYHAPDEGGWIAHGLHTDQVGIDATPVDALAQLIRLVHKLFEEAALDGSIATHREAPSEIQEMANRSKTLPKEVVEVAHWKATGKWPQDWQFQPPKNDDSFVVEVEELCVA